MNYTCRKLIAVIRLFIPAILFFIITVVLLTLPGSAFPDENWMGKIHFDKFIHIGLFSMLTFLYCWGFYRRHHQVNAHDAERKLEQRSLLRAFILTAMVTFLYGIIMEYVQRDFIPNRSFDSGDILADGAGSLAGFLYSRYRFIKK
ncbi:MAG: VanZ family protein [Chitinophagaceae bacterium]